MDKSSSDGLVFSEKSEIFLLIKNKITIKPETKIPIIKNSFCTSLFYHKSKMSRAYCIYDFNMVLLVQMNKKIIIAIVIIIGLGGYFLLNNKSQTSDNSLVTSEKESAGEETISGTLKSLLFMGKSQKCTYSASVDSTTVTGIIYVADKKIRGDYSSTSEEMKISGHMIVDEKYSYVWTDASKQGFKMANDEQEKMSEDLKGKQVENQAVDLEKKFTYKCQGWSKDNSLFIPPSDISFSTFDVPSIEPSAFIPQDAGINCSTCDNVPEGTARDTCKSQLGCE